MVGRDAFDLERFDRFWRFVAERQRTWARRVVLEEAPPWTADVVVYPISVEPVDYCDG